MKQYLDYLGYILANGVVKDSRPGIQTLDVFGYQNRYNLQDGFPIVTTKKTSFSLILSELLWFLRGDSNINFLLEHNNHIWDEWADENGNLGRGVYGKMWRAWPHPDGHTVDQISDVIHEIQNNPNSRRLMVVTYNPALVSKKDVGLPPCHVMFQFDVTNGKLSCQMYQRSADSFLGVPFNIASYAILTHMIAQVCDLEVGEFIHSFGSAHIYLNHLEQVNLQLTRQPFPLPKLWLNPEVKNIFDFGMEDVKLIGYQHHPAIKGEVAV
jgi:thymidylate synthase